MTLKNDESKSSSMMTARWEEQVLKCDKHEVINDAICSN